MKLIAAVSCAFLALATSPLSGATIQGGRIDNLACDNGFFSVTAGPQTIKVQKFAIYAYHQEKTKYYVYYHAGELEDSIRTDATQWTLLSTTEVQPTGLDNAFELSAGGTFIAANEVGSFMITADLANDNGAIWGGRDGELTNDDLTVGLVKWFVRLGPDAAKPFTLTRSCGGDTGYGGVITYATILESRPAQILTQPPASVALIESQTLRLEVTAGGTGPFVYQWKKDGADLPGATAPVYTKRAQLGDAGGYTCTVQGAVGAAATTASVAVSIAADKTPPTLISVSSNEALDVLLLQFSEPVDPVEVISIGHYQISGGVTVFEISLGEDGSRVTLSVSRLNSFTTYTLSAEGIADLAAAKNKLPVGSKIAFTTPAYRLTKPTVATASSWVNAYFTVTAGAKDITLLTFAPIAWHGDANEYRLYTLPGDYVGQEFVEESWTLVASQYYPPSISPLPRLFPRMVIPIAAGGIQSFLLTRTNAPGGTFYVGSPNFQNNDFTVSPASNFSRGENGVIFSEGTAGTSVDLAGYFDYCLSSCHDPVSPPLAIRFAADQVTLSWAAVGYKLQISPSLNPPAWVDAGAASPINVTVGKGTQFFHLVPQ